MGRTRFVVYIWLTSWVVLGVILFDWQVGRARWLLGFDCTKKKKWVRAMVSFRIDLTSVVRASRVLHFTVVDWQVGRARCHFVWISDQQPRIVCLACPWTSHSSRLIMWAVSRACYQNRLNWSECVQVVWLACRWTTPSCCPCCSFKSILISKCFNFRACDR